MSTHWQKLNRIFREAQLVSAEEQPDFISRACGTDAVLRADIASLLSAGNESGTFMEKPALERLARQFAADGLNLQPGRRIGAYTIVKKLGFGGAGEVWRANDERLGRDVAIKVLLPHWSTDTDKLRGFMDEARTAGSLNHPNILIVHDVGEQDGVPYLVSECLEGRNLRERLKAGRIPVSEAIAVTLGIAHGLAAAHERGIVHRDLKPENTFLKSDGSVKLLDFGLAKLKVTAETPGIRPGEIAMEAIAGTAGYMAPEQARGEPVDQRSDLFALGLMMYEMLAGKHPLRGASDFETLHAILTREPEDLAGNAPVPPALSRIVMRLLEKIPEARFQSARDLAWSVAQLTNSGQSPTDKSAKRPTFLSLRLLWIGIPVLIAGALLGYWWSSNKPLPAPASSMARFTWALPEGFGLDSVPSVAPNGKQIAFTAKDSTVARLFVRDLQSLDARAIAGSEGATLPFWSPNGDSLGFFADGRLMKVSLPNGAPTVITEAPSGHGGAWTQSGVIVFAPDLILSGLSRISVEGGDAEPATVLDPSQNEAAHQWPVALPDGIHFLYFVRSPDDGRRGIYLGRVDRPATRAGERLFYSESGAAYVPHSAPGRADLIYLSKGRVEIRGFDVETLIAAGNARTLDFVTSELTVNHPPMVTVSTDVMAFAKSVVPRGNQLESFSMDGKSLKLWENAEGHNWPRVSPDGRLLARQHIDATLSQPDIWVEDLERGTVYPVTSTLKPDMAPVWSPDGSQLAFVTGHLPGRRGELALNLAAADGTGIVRTLKCPGDYCEPTDWSADGSSLLVNVREAANQNVWTVSTRAGDGAAPLLAAEYAESDARYSRDGKWVAYVSREAGRPEIWVHSVSGTPSRRVVSGAGGTQPVWRRDGKALYFVDLQGRLQRVAVHWGEDGAPVFGLPDQPAVPRIGFGHWGTQYDISPDGSRIYFMKPNEAAPPREIQLVLNWRALVE